MTRTPSSSDSAPATTAAAASPIEWPITAPGCTPYDLIVAASATCMVNSGGLDPVDAGHRLGRRHRLGHREPGLAGDQRLRFRDGRGEHRFGRKQLGAHRGPLRTLAGEHPHRSPVVLPDRGLIRSVAVGDLAQRLGQLRRGCSAITAVRTGRCARRRARV